MSQKNESLLRDLQFAIGKDIEHPPVEKWNPTQIGSIDICIRSDGSWLHEGGDISRKALVRLFASVLRLDPDGYCLVTPVEKLLIKVEDVPFVVTSIEKHAQAGSGQIILMKTNVEDTIALSSVHPLKIDYSASGEPRPYVLVRNGLWARLLRHVYYELINFGEIRNNRIFVTSGDMSFDLGEVS